MEVFLYPLAFALAFGFLQYSRPNVKEKNKGKAQTRSTMAGIASTCMNLFICTLFFMSLKELLMYPCRSYTVPDQSGKTFIITGANSGLGLETARRLMLANAGYVIMGCRSLHKCHQAVESTIATSMPFDKWTERKERVKCMYIDLSVLETIERFVAQVVEEVGQVDVLINNAGIMNVPERTLVSSMASTSNNKDGNGGSYGDRKGSDGAEMVELTLCANHLGHFLLTSLLLPYINTSSGIIINHSSGMGLFPATLPSLDSQYTTFNDDNYDGWQAYINSKKANLLFTYALNRRLTTSTTSDGSNEERQGKVYDYSNSHIKSIAVHPGYTATALQHGAIPLSEWNNYLFGMTVYDGAMSQLRAATDPEVAPSMGSMLGPALGGWGPAWFSIPTLGVRGEEEEMLWRDSGRLIGGRGVFK